MQQQPSIRVLGSIEVDDGDGPVALGARQHVLLAVLAAHAGTVVPVDVLVDAIWDGERDHTGALHTLVSRLRSRLPDGALVTRAPGYALTAEFLDAARFEELVKVADELPSADAALSLLDEAASLWRGPAFGTVADRDAVQARATELDELRTIAAERRARILIDVGRPADAVVAVERLIREHPLREHPVALAMEALARSGRQRDALRRFAELSERLVEGVGLEPSTELAQLHDLVLADDMVEPSPATTTTATTDRFPLSLKPRTVERRPGEPVAYATIGSGPALVFMPGWISSLDAFTDGSDPRALLLARLADAFTVTVFDRYGTGLSAAEHVDSSLEASVDEIRAIVAVAGDHPVLFASSAAGPAALMAAAQDAEIGRLVLMCTYADGPALFTSAGNQASLIELVEQSWGMGSRILADMVVPGIDAVTRSAFARFQRRAASPTVAAAYVRQLYDADATRVLADISQPALVLHYRDDPAIPYAGARQLALGVDDAVLVPLDGPYHTPPAEHVEQICQAVVDFVTSS